MESENGVKVESLKAELMGSGFDIVPERLLTEMTEGVEVVKDGSWTGELKGYQLETVEALRAHFDGKMIIVLDTAGAIGPAIIASRLHEEELIKFEDRRGPSAEGTMELTLDHVRSVHEWFYGSEDRDLLPPGAYEGHYAHIDVPAWDEACEEWHMRKREGKRLKMDKNNRIARDGRKAWQSSHGPKARPKRK